nr:ribonuclease H-like domain-containing protein [Tanacetum cinerariifolium]
MQAIENRFRGNAATKKTQKNLLKQQYENFDASSTEVIEQTYERLQNLISQLEMHGKVIPQKDTNQKFLRSLSQEWTMHTIMWRNKPEIKTLSLDDLFNNLKAYESSHASHTYLIYTAIENRFRGNAATKKTQKNLLKQQYENFDASSTEAYESKVKGTSTSTTNSHNVAFLSSSSTNRAVNTAHGGNTTNTQGATDSSTTVENLSDTD